MGLAVLPARLKSEMENLAKAMVSGADIRNDEVLGKHADWVDMLKEKHDINADNVDEIIRKEIGIVYSEILEQCGVFSRDEKGRAQLIKFIESVK